MENIQFIEVNRVLSDKDTKINTSTQPESIDVSIIESFRGWHKGKNDIGIKGELTLLILKDRENKNPESNSGAEEKNRVRTMLIQESYKDFLNRMSARVVVRKLSDNEAVSDPS